MVKFETAKFSSKIQSLNITRDKLCGYTDDIVFILTGDPGSATGFGTSKKILDI